MAVGDIVNGISALNTILQFQPAATVSVAITSIGDINVYVYITDGVLSARSYSNNTGNANQSGSWNTKIMINNTNYIYFPGSALDSTYYSGIQIQ